MPNGPMINTPAHQSFEDNFDTGTDPETDPTPDGPEHPTPEELAADNLNLLLAQALNLDPRMIMADGFTIKTDGSGTVHLTWESAVGIEMEFFAQIVNSMRREQGEVELNQ